MTIPKSLGSKKARPRTRRETILEGSLKKQKTDDNQQTKRTKNGKEPSTGRFANGNQLWKVRTKCGRSSRFSSAEQLLQACEKYLEWVDDHPLYEYKEVGICRGKPLIVEIPKRRPMTIRGLCLFMGISQVTWWNYKKRSAGFLNVCCCVEQVIWIQKFEGVVVGFFKPAIIARESGWNK